MAVSEALRATRLGSLKYDNGWLESGKVNDILALCNKFDRTLILSVDDERMISTSPKSSNVSEKGSGLGGGNDSVSRTPSYAGLKIGETSLGSKMAETPSSQESPSAKSGESCSITVTDDKRDESLSRYEMAALQNENEWELRRQTAFDNRWKLLRTQWNQLQKMITSSPSSPLTNKSAAAEQEQREQQEKIDHQRRLTVELASQERFQREQERLEADQKEQQEYARQLLEQQRRSSSSIISQQQDARIPHSVVEQETATDSSSTAQTSAQHSQFVKEEPAAVDDQGAVVARMQQELQKQQFQESQKQEQIQELQKQRIQELQKKQEIEELEKQREIRELQKQQELQELQKQQELQELQKQQQLQELQKRQTETEESQKQQTQASVETKSAMETEMEALSHIHLAGPDAARFTSATKLLEYKRQIASFQSHKEEYEIFQKRMLNGLCSKTAERAVKAIRQELTVGVTTSINVLTAGNVEEKLTRLGQLLSGKTVLFRNNKLSVQKHPDAKEFCCELIARTLVKQAENVVSVQPDMAFPLASIAIGLWVEFPEVGAYLKAAISSNCLYTVPYYVPRLEGETDQEYYKKLGYQIGGRGELEKQTQFLKRVGGVCRFYAALMCTPAVPWNSFRYFGRQAMRSTTRHPIDFDVGWSFLVNMVHLTPRTDITATVLLEFLEMLSHFLKKTYGRQFEKLLKYINDHYMNEISTVSSPGAGSGAFARLKSFLNSGQKRYALPPHYPNAWRRCE